MPTGLDVDRFCEQIIVTLHSAELTEVGQKITYFDPEKAPILARHVEHLYVRVYLGEDSLLWFRSDLQSGVVTCTEGLIAKTACEFGLSEFIGNARALVG